MIPITISFTDNKENETLRSMEALQPFPTLVYELSLKLSLLVCKLYDTFPSPLSLSLICFLIASSDWLRERRAFSRPITGRPEVNSTSHVTQEYVRP